MKTFPGVIIGQRGKRGILCGLPIVRYGLSRSLFSPGQGRSSGVPRRDDGVPAGGRGMRVIASFPDVTVDEPAVPRRAAGAVAPSDPGLSRPAPPAVPSRRDTGRSMFPTWSVAALAVVAAAVWTCVALGERSLRATPRSAHRLAAEPARAADPPGTVSR